MRIAWVYTRRFVLLMHTISSVKTFDSEAQATMSGINPRLSASDSRPVKQAWLYSGGGTTESQAVQSLWLFHKADTELKNGFVHVVVTQGFFFYHWHLFDKKSGEELGSECCRRWWQKPGLCIRWRKAINEKNITKSPPLCGESFF